MNVYTWRNIFWARSLARVPLAPLGKKRRQGSRKEDVSMWSREFMQRVVFPRREKRSVIIAQTTCFTASHSSHVTFSVHVTCTWDQVTTADWKHLSLSHWEQLQGSHHKSMWLRIQVIICVSSSCWHGGRANGNVFQSLKAAQTSELLQ